ncbi:MAG TPA: hypothetical protein VM537_09860 [Anaerolineae bacterium]|nr:hypothetical protein [Anaerolineae bacterium]
MADKNRMALRAVMEWLEEKEQAYPVTNFVPLCGYEQDRINKELQFLGINRDRLSADISRLWCAQLREAIDALPEESKADKPTHCCGASGFGKEWPGEPRDICPACEVWAKERRGEVDRG